MRALRPFRRPVRPVLAVEVRCREVIRIRLITPFDIIRPEKLVARLVERRERRIYSRQFLEIPLATLPARHAAARRDTNGTMTPPEVAIGIDKPPLAAHLLHSETARRPEPGAFEPAAPLVASRRTGMRRKIRVLLGKRPCEVRIRLHLARPVAPLELSVPVDEREEPLRRNLRKGRQWIDRTVRRPARHDAPHARRSVDAGLHEADAYDTGRIERPGLHLVAPLALAAPAVVRPEEVEEPADIHRVELGDARLKRGHGRRNRTHDLGDILFKVDVRAERPARTGTARIGHKGVLVLHQQIEERTVFPAVHPVDFNRKRSATRKVPTAGHRYDATGRHNRRRRCRRII